MTPRHPRDGDPLDREVDEALALANESPPQGRPAPPETEEDWADAALSLANGRPVRSTGERSPGPADGAEGPGRADGLGRANGPGGANDPGGPGGANDPGGANGANGAKGPGGAGDTDDPVDAARTDWVETALDLARESAGERAGVLDAQGHVRRRPEMCSRSRSPGSPTSEGPAKNPRSRASGPQTPAPHPKRTPG
ncbi:hypothetical protein JBE04_42775, partial [Streptomyces sp. PRKS01-29]|nr:hypothetical protein [Streptomyces sabulosicollis]